MHQCCVLCCLCTAFLSALFSGLDVTFVLTDHSKSWTEAQSYCREHHTDLASVRNEAENQKVQELVPGGGGFVWIGLFRDSWKWSDGSSSSFRYWRSGQPNNYGGQEACAAADFSSSGRWVDVKCDEKFPFICSGPSECVFEEEEEDSEEIEDDCDCICCD
ncbi:lectin-like [Centropristis striata]|uniref:lectin-like n=1 Tax=Centropristis striata TaxID=184440 RepID=UPI0027E1056A|nr:lectin-like [Centropristis striata]XP_059189399.1 lectin-like [Centropristis striata]